MKSLLKIASIMTLTATAWAAKPIPNQGPLPKNLAAHEFTQKDAKRRAAKAESATDHMKLANFYEARPTHLMQEGLPMNGPLPHFVMAHRSRT